MPEKSSAWILEQNNVLANRSAEERLAWAWTTFGLDCVCASSLGAEDQVLVHLIAKFAPEVEIFTLDTGRLFQETYELIERTEAKYQRKIKVFFPEREPLERMIQEGGINLFYQSVANRKRCCGVRKVEPLRRALSGKRAWICGLRAAQSSARREVQPLEWDDANGLYRINPLADWTDEAVWSFIREHSVPYNELHDKGFPSIGCAPCTRAVAAGQDVRAGRWWWEQEDQKECGLHAIPEKR